MIKYKVGLVISGEEMFKILSWFLPAEITSIEEVFEKPPAPPVEKVAKKVKKIKVKSGFRGIPINLNKGLNKIIMDKLADGEAHRPYEFDGPVVEGGYSRNSVGSLLSKLEKRGIVFQPKPGYWQKVDNTLRSDNGTQ